MSITLFIIILTILVSFTCFRNRLAFERMKFNAYEIRLHKSFYRFVSYGLLHADWMHLLVNMFVLFSFGTVVENIFRADLANSGKMVFGLLYVSSLIVSTLPSFIKHRKNYYYNAVGASGAVSAVLFASIILNSTIQWTFYQLVLCTSKIQQSKTIRRCSRTPCSSN